MATTISSSIRVKALARPVRFRRMRRSSNWNLLVMNPKNTFSHANLHDGQWGVNDLKLVRLRDVLATARAHTVLRASGADTSPGALTANQPD